MKSFRLLFPPMPAYVYNCAQTLSHDCMYDSIYCETIHYSLQPITVPYIFQHNK